MPAIADSASGEIVAVLVRDALRHNDVAEQKVDPQPVRMSWTPNPAKRLLSVQRLDIAHKGGARRRGCGRSAHAAIPAAARVAEVSSRILWAMPFSSRNKRIARYVW